MNLQEPSYAAMRLLLKKPMTATAIALITGREVRHTKRSMESLVAYRMVSTQDIDGIRYYSLTASGMDCLHIRYGVKPELQYVQKGRIHPNVDWPWVYREAA